MAKTTFIKLDRDILNWRWYMDANTFRVFVHLLLKANIEDHDFERVTIHRGEVATSLGNLAKELNISIQSARTAISHLKSTGEITSTGYNKFTVISIVKYDLYQAKLTSKPTINQQSSNKQLTSSQQQSKNIKNVKKDKNIYIGDDELRPCGKLLFLSDEQYRQLESEITPSELLYYIDKVDDWLATHQVPKESHYQLIKTFISNDRK